MNVVLVPAVLLLIGLALYKKVLEPRRAAAGGRKESKAENKAVKVRASSGSGRMGSVL